VPPNSVVGVFDANRATGRALRAALPSGGAIFAGNRGAGTVLAGRFPQFPAFIALVERGNRALERAIGAAGPSFPRSAGENRPVDLARIAWLVTVGACLIAVLVLVLQGYLGYAAVTFAVALAAAINLF
jgi:hypothetical protein